MKKGGGGEILLCYHLFIAIIVYWRSFGMASGGPILLDF